MHQLVADRLGVDDNLPCADYGLLVPLKRSREYRAIRKRVLDLRPTDAWQQEGFHFFVFVLRAADGPDIVLPEPPVAVFAMHPEVQEPVSAVVVTPRGDGTEAEIRNVRDPDSAYTAPIAG
jgi:hypothetical protein